MAHFNFVISQNSKWGHAGFYIDCHRMTVPENILLQKSTVCTYSNTGVPELPFNNCDSSFQFKCCGQDFTLITAITPYNSSLSLFRKMSSLAFFLLSCLLQGLTHLCHDAKSSDSDRVSTTGTQSVVSVRPSVRLFPLYFFCTD